ncbi:MAG: tetratricopeptide repeat protein [Desulfobacterales bacterium]|nr:tetratricopeptide repeat protein [Desulfobacterales bacterium]
MINDPKPRQELIRSRCSTQQFLLSKTDPTLKKEPRPKYSADGMGVVTETFPRTLHGEAFLHQAADFTGACENFISLAIRIDHFLRDVTEEKDDPMERTQKAVAGVIDRICSKFGGLWGILDADIFGCFFSFTDSPSGRDLAERIQKSLAAESEATISIGIAVFPTLRYDRLQILENALKALDHAAFFGPDAVVEFDAVSLNISGDQLYQEGDVAEAAEEYRQALQLAPDNVNVHNSLGVCYGITEDWDRALEAFGAALQIDPTETMAVYNTGVIHMLKKEIDRALEYFRKAAEKEPDIFEVAFQTGRTYLEKGAAKEAVLHLKRAAALNSAAAAVHRMLGEALEANEDENGAMAAYRQAIKKNPNDAAALSALGSLLDRRGEDPEIAELFCRQSTEIEPDNGLYRQRLGEVYLRREQFKEAVEAFEAAGQLGAECSELLLKAAHPDRN